MGWTKGRLVSVIARAGIKKETIKRTRKRKASDEDIKTICDLYNKGYQANYIYNYICKYTPQYIRGVIDNEINNGRLKPQRRYVSRNIAKSHKKALESSEFSCKSKKTYEAKDFRLKDDVVYNFQLIGKFDTFYHFRIYSGNTYFRYAIMDYDDLRNSVRII